MIIELYSGSKHKKNIVTNCNSTLTKNINTYIILNTYKELLSYINNNHWGHLGHWHIVIPRQHSK